MVKEVVGPDQHNYVHFIDLFPYFKGRRDAELWVHPIDQHPNEIAHRLAAEALSKDIEDNVDLSIVLSSR